MEISKHIVWMYLLLLSASSSLLMISTSFIALETSLPAQGGPILVVGGGTWAKITYNRSNKNKIVLLLLFHISFKC